MCGAASQLTLSIRQVKSEHQELTMHPNLTAVIAAERNEELLRRAAQRPSPGGQARVSRVARPRVLGTTIRRYFRRVSPAH